MIISYFYLECISVGPAKADTPLIVDRYCILPGSIPLQGMKVIAGWNLEIVEAGRQVYVLKATIGSTNDVRRHPFRFTGQKHLPGVLIGKGFDHLVSITCHVTRVDNRFIETVSNQI
jgi:hypothetical protein